MSPPAERADLVLEAADLVPAERLEDGEVVILAVKPSRWLALLVSWPVVVVAAVVTGAAYAAARLWAVALNDEMVALLCSAAACTRVTVGCFQWLGRLYVLTNRRVMRFSGVFRQDCRHCPLKDVREVHPSATLAERLFAVGSLLFELRDDRRRGGHWMHLSDPREVLRIVEEARRRAV